MNSSLRKKWGIAALVWLVAMSVVLPTARGELVYEDEISEEEATDQLQDREENREGERQVIRKVVRKKPKAQQIVIVEEEEPSSDNNEAQATSGSELVRRERVREELRNEDLLSRRIEELRLRDEKKRTEQILGANIEGQDAQQTQTIQTTPVQQQVIGQPAITDQVVQSAAAVEVAPVGVTADEEEVSEGARVGLMPRMGLSNLAGTPTGYSVNPRYSVGLGLLVDIDDHLGFEAGYAFSEYGVSLNSANPYVSGYQYYTGYRTNKYETVAMKQNVFDLGLKVYLLNRKSKFRPFIGGGGAYAKTFINYDKKVLNTMKQYGMTQYTGDYEVSQYLGFLSTGLDIQISKNVSIGGTFKYYNVLTSNENQKLNNAALYGYGPYQAYGYYPYSADLDKEIVGGSFAKANFYSVLLGATFSF